MATNGIISIVKGGEVIFKCVAGCDGMNAAKAAIELKKLSNPSLNDVYKTCSENGFGCDACLVVQSKKKTLCSDPLDELSPLYQQKFSDPQFNPRWERGTAAYTEIIELQEIN